MPEAPVVAVRDVIRIHRDDLYCCAPDGSAGCVCYGSDDSAINHLRHYRSAVDCKQCNQRNTGNEDPGARFCERQSTLKQREFRAAE